MNPFFLSDYERKKTDLINKITRYSMSKVAQACDLTIIKGHNIAIWLYTQNNSELEAILTRLEEPP